MLSRESVEEMRRRKFRAVALRERREHADQESALEREKFRQTLPELRGFGGIESATESVAGSATVWVDPAFLASAQASPTHVMRKAGEDAAKNNPPAGAASVEKKDMSEGSEPVNIEPINVVPEGSEAVNKELINEEPVNEPEEAVNGTTQKSLRPCCCIC